MTNNEWFELECKKMNPFVNVKFIEEHYITLECDDNYNPDSFKITICRNDDYSLVIREYYGGYKFLGGLTAIINEYRIRESYNDMIRINELKNLIKQAGDE